MRLHIPYSHRMQCFQGLLALRRVACDEEIFLRIIFRHPDACIPVLHTVTNHEIIVLLTVASEGGFHVGGLYVLGICNPIALGLQFL